MTSAQHAADDNAVLSLTDIQPFPRFIESCKAQGLASEAQLRWFARYRAENGLMACGALVEKRADPKSRKPKLFVVVPRFVGWLATSNLRGSA